MNKFKNYMNNLLVFYADYFEHVYHAYSTNDRACISTTLSLLKFVIPL